MSGFRIGSKGKQTKHESPTVFRCRQASKCSLHTLASINCFVLFYLLLFFPLLFLFLCACCLCSSVRSSVQAAACLGPAIFSWKERKKPQELKENGSKINVHWSNPASLQQLHRFWQQQRKELDSLQKESWAKLRGIPRNLKACFLLSNQK